MLVDFDDGAAGIKIEFEAPHFLYAQNIGYLYFYKQNSENF